MWEALWPLLRTLLFVVLILCLAYLFTKYVVGSGKLGGLAAGKRMGNLQVLAQLALGKDQRLLLVKAGERYFLLGATPSGISNLAEFTQEEAASWIETTDQPDGSQTSSFREALQTVLKQRRQR